MICSIKKIAVPCIPDPTGLYRRILRRAKMADCYRGKMSVVITVAQPPKPPKRKTKSK